MNKKLILTILAAAATALFIPMAALAIIGVWLLVTSPVWFGIVFMSALTFMVLKNLAFTAAVFVVTCILGGLWKWKIESDERKLVATNTGNTPIATP